MANHEWNANAYNRNGAGKQMENSARASSADSTNGAVHVLGFCFSIVVAALTTVTFAIAVFTPPISGPFCMESCIAYPYLDIAARFPRDYLWMYPAIILSLVFIVWIACIHQFARAEKRVFSQIGLSFALIGATMLVLVYYVQLAVIQPSIVNGETAGIALLTQYNPHGIFIALEDIGYLMVSLALVCLVPVFSSSNRVETALRWVFSISIAAAITALVAVSMLYGVHREYRFEVIVISIVWLELIVTGVLGSIVFRRAMRLPASDMQLRGI